MAAVMMRAMGVKTSSSSSSSSSTGANGRASSDVARSSHASGDGGEQWDSDSLSRQTSRLSPPNPAFVIGSPAGILINALRPPSPNMPYADPPSAGSGSTSSLSEALPPSALPGSELHPSVSAPPGDGDRGRSSSRESARPGAGGRGLSDTTNASSTTTGGDSGHGTGGRKIRFAPLPEIRPRSYSTGRNVWLGDGSSDPEDARTGPWVLRRDGDTGLPANAIDDDDDSLDDDIAEPTSPVKTMFGSWKTDLASFGVSSSSLSSSRSVQDESSYSKLLRPLSFGMVGKKEKKKRSGRPSSVEGRSESLTRVSSNESDVSRGTSVSSHEVRLTGIPMRKTRTWESNDSINASPVRESRRANYPPVAQRSRNRRQPLPVSISAPEFNEWGSGGSVGSFTSKLGSGSGAVEDDDDGGGMAWIRKRRAQREAEAARKKAEEEEEAEQKKREEEEAEEAMKGLEDEGVEEPDLADTMELDGGDEEGLGFETPTTSSPRQTLLLSGIGSNLASPSATTHKDETPVPTTRTLDVSTMSNGNIDAVVEVAPPTAGHRSGSPEPMVTPSKVDDPTISATSTKLDNLSLGSKGPASKEDEDDEDLEISTDDDDEDDEDDSRDEDEDDSDLDEDELAQEEALAETARATAKSAGAERYHSASHQTAVVTPHQDSRTSSAAASMIGVPPPSVGPRVSTPIRQGTITQANFNGIV